jgi:hypothetical protein
MKIVFKDGKPTVVGSVKQTVKVGPEGQQVDTEVDVPVDREVALPEGAAIFTQDQLRDNFIPKPDFERRAESIAANKLTTALDDETFKATALAKWGIDTSKTGKLDGEQLQAVEQTWEKEKLQPAQQRAETAEQRAGRLLERSLVGDIMGAAARLGLKDTFVTSPVKGEAPPIINMVRSYFKADAETDQWYAKHGDGFALSAKPEEGRTYKDPNEFLEEFVRANTWLLDDKRQRGAGLQDTSDPSKLPIGDQIDAAEAAGNMHEADRLKAVQLESLAVR